MINDIITEYCWDLNAEKERLYKEREHKPRLWMSNLGGCIRKAYFDMDGAEKTHPFDKLLIRKFRAGSDEEDKTVAAFLHKWPNGVLREVPVGNEMWSGKIDILVAQNEDFPNGAIMENKGTSPYGMKKGMIPRLTHCYQVLAYQKFLNAGYEVPAYLYYRCWDFYAQFEITSATDENDDFFGFGYVEFVGDINGREESGGYTFNLDTELERMENFWGREPMDTPGYDSPFTESFACTKSSRKGKKWKQINCLYFGHCFPELAEKASEDRLLEVE